MAACSGARSVEIRSPTTFMNVRHVGSWPAGGAASTVSRSRSKSRPHEGWAVLRGNHWMDGELGIREECVSSTIMHLV